MIEVLNQIPFKLAQWEIVASVASSLVLEELEKSADILSLGSYCERPQYGVTQSASPEAVGPRFVRITDIQSGSIDWESVPYCRCEGPEKHRLSAGDILIGRTGSVGKTVLVERVPEPAVFASYLIRVTPYETVLPGYLYWCFQSAQFWRQLLNLSRGSAIRNINSTMLQSLRFPIPDRSDQAEAVSFLNNVVALTKGDAESLPISKRYQEQSRIVAKIQLLANRVGEVDQLRRSIHKDGQAVLRSAFQQIIDGAKYYPTSEVAPIVRRKVEIAIDGAYPELGVRSFGKGVFHKPTLVGSELTWQKLFHVKAGDLIFSNIKAWEGAIAVARKGDNDRVGSHRYITCVPSQGVTTADFLCFYLLTEEGIEQVQAASPGSADRNRTLAMERLKKIRVPVPKYDKQLWFNRLQDRVASIGFAQADNQVELDAMLPAILDRAIKREL